MTRDDRGQIQFDFAVGVSIFVMSIVVAFTFVPGLIGGVTEGRQQGDQVGADRVAAWLAEDGLGDPSRPGEADTRCVRSLFDDAYAACGFDRADVDDNVFVTDRNVVVSIRNGSSQVCWDDAEAKFVEEGDTGPSDCRADAGHTVLAAQGEPAGGSSVARATRPINMDGYQATVVVRVW